LTGWLLSALRGWACVTYLCMNPILGCKACWCC
jgi:hypothetical protein